MGQFKCITAPINSLKGVPTFLMLMWLSQKILGNSQEQILSCLCEAGPFKDRLDCVESKTQIPLSLHRALLKTNLKKIPELFMGPHQLPDIKQPQPAVLGKNAKFGTAPERGKGLDFKFWEKMPWEQLLLVWVFEGHPKLNNWGVQALLNTRRFQFLLIRLSKTNSVFPDELSKFPKGCN